MNVGFSATGIVTALKANAIDLQDFEVKNVRTVSTANRKDNFNHAESIGVTLKRVVATSFPHIQEGDRYSVLISGLMTPDNRTGWEFVPVFVKPFRLT